MKLPKDLSKKEIVERIHKYLGLFDEHNPQWHYAENIREIQIRSFFEYVFGKECDRVIATSTHDLFESVDPDDEMKRNFGYETK